MEKRMMLLPALAVWLLLVAAYVRVRNRTRDLPNAVDLHDEFDHYDCNCSEDE